MNNKDYVIVKDGEMVHFKYIKREKVNGEWRYYYDKGSIGRSIKKAVGIDARNAYRSAKDAAVAAENAHKEAYETKRKEVTEAAEAAKKLSDAKNNGPEYESPAMKLARTKLAKESATRSVKEAADEYAKQAKEASDASKKTAEAAKKSVEAQKKAEEALKKYYKTPLGSLKFLSDKGKELLYKIF